MIALHPDISIIVPTYNSKNFIRETLESIQLQKLNKECFVIDNCSTDKTELIVKDCVIENLKFISEPDNGQADAINKGVKKANGKIINWLNSDDYYESNALQIVNKHFDDSTNVVAGRSRIFDNNGTKHYSRGTDIYPDNLPKTLGWARIDQPETFFRKSAWDKVGLLKEELHCVFDREWWIRYLFHFGLNGFKKIPDILVNFRLHKNSKTVSRSNEFIKEDRIIYAAYAKKIEAYDIEELILISENIQSNVSIEIPIVAFKELIVPMLHYYLLKLGHEYYAQDETKLANKFLNKVDTEFLSKEDRYLLRNLKFRNQIPKPIIKLFRRR